MAGLYQLLRHHSLACSDPLLKNLLSFLPTSFLSHIFVYMAFEDSDQESFHSND